MCDQTEVQYLEDDVVWVKIGPIWWPGIVKDLEKDDEGKEILAGLKKKPIAVVKFFQEDNYEFVKNLEHIYHYSCRRKDEFIKKGLDKYRTGAPHMKKFPSDVTTAESLTNGDINIINDPKFYPEKKESYSEIFGSGKKKSKKDSESTPKHRVQSSAGVTPYRPITHQRFINKVLHGKSDHKVKTLIQCNSSSDDGTSRNPYRCHICKFETSRVNVIVAHHRLSHSPKTSVNWTGSDSKLIRRKPVYKSRKVKSKKLFDTSKEDVSDDDGTEKKKSKSKSHKEKAHSSEKYTVDDASTSPSKRKNKDENLDSSDSKKPRFTDVLLADWNVEEEEDKKDTAEDDSKEDKAEKDISETENVPPPVENAENSVTVTTKKNSEKMSCFDFDEEEDGFIGMSNANTYGRKIPRVIPPKDKSELGMDLEIEELFKKKNEEGNQDQEITSDEVEMDENKIESPSESNETSESDKQTQSEEKPAPVSGKRRKSRISRDEEIKVNAEDSLALRRTRRPGAKKSYLNEVIEKVDSQDDMSDSDEEGEQEKADAMEEEKIVKIETEKSKPAKEESSSSSRRKQDFKQHTMDSSREEIIYSEIVSEQKSKTTGEQPEKKKTKTHNKNTRRRASVDLTSQIDDLLNETKLPTLPELSQSTNDKTEVLEKSDDSKSSSNNFSFDYLPSEQSGKKGKTKAEVKSISRMFSDSISSSEGSSDATMTENQNATVVEEVKESTETKSTTDGTQGKTANAVNAKFSSATTNSSQKRGSIVLSTVPKTSETSGQLKVLPVLRQASATKDCIVLPAGKKFEIKNIGEDGEELSTELESVSRPKNIKAIKVKSDSLPSSLITSGKLKGQTIIHQKGGKYVIVTQPPQAGRSRATPGKVQSGSKVVILTNQLGEQKIITTGGLQQTKFKVEGQKIIATPDGISDTELSSASTSGSVGQAQPVIKVVPDGKGGIMKKLTVSPKKVLLGGTKVLVSGSGSTFSSGNSIQKIAFSSGGSVARASGGDFRLIENYKGSGKTVLIQGGSNATSGVVLKSTSVVPRHLTKVIQNPQNISALKKKPKILMRATTGQGEYVMQSASGTIESSPTYVVKQKGSDGKYCAQKIVRTEMVNQPKVSLAGTGTKTFLVSGQGSNTKGESYIITTNESVPGKVIRMRQKIKESDISTSKTAQKIIQKTPEVYTISQNSLLIPSQTPPESEIPIVQTHDQTQQPVLQTQVIAMPGPVGADGNQTYVLVSVDENGVVQGMDNSVVAYDATAQSNQLFANSSSANNVILINPQANEEVAPVFSTSSQDILAEALANTNVLEGSISNEIESVVPSILLPPSIPSSVVQETSITLQKPIMTPLEMPSSVTPDTSGLEPPPLPPTPTEEDVLMEDTEMSVDGVPNQEPLVQNDKKDDDSTSTDAIQTYLQPRNFGDTEPSFQINTFAKEDENQKMFDEQYVEQKSEVGGDANEKEMEFYQTSDLSESTNSGQEVFKELPREDFIIENSQEGQSTNSFQSLPVLNDEPDTMDDAQASQPIADQNFDAEKSRMDAEQFSRLLREQEPPSSTNNEILTDGNHEGSFETSNDKYQSYEMDNRENEPKNKDVEQETPEDQNVNDGWQKDKEIITSETQSLPIIASDTSTNPYDMESIYSDAISQKRIQEETEVSSTTDEFTSKDITN